MEIWKVCVGMQVVVKIIFGLILFFVLSSLFGEVLQWLMKHAIEQSQVNMQCI